MKFSVKTIAVIGLVIVAIAALVGRRFLSSDPDSSMRVSQRGAVAKAVSVSAVVLKPSPLKTNISSTGSLAANEEVVLRPEAAGKVLKIYFNEGAVVQKGQLLVKINDDELQAKLAQSQYQSKLADDKLHRAEQLLKTQGVSQADYDATLAEANSLGAGIDLLKAQIAKTEIRAPFTGVVGLRGVSEGAFVSTETAIASLQDISKLKLDFAIPERYATQLARGTVVSFAVAGSEKQYPAAVYAIEPKIDMNTRTVQVRALCESSESSLLPGALANVEIPLEEIPDAILAPTQALVPDLKGYKVFVCQDGKAAMRTVETGYRTEGTVHLTKGVQAGDTLITTGLLQLRPGLAVQISDLQGAM